MDSRDRQEIEQLNSGENGWIGDPDDMNGEECEGSGVDGCDVNKHISPDGEIFYVASDREVEGSDVDGCEHHDRRINLERCTVQCMTCETDLMSLDAFVTLSPRALRQRV